MNEKIKSILDTQIIEELHSAHVYLALSARLESWNLKGMANWMMIQAKEENDHAMGFFRFLIERGAEPTMLAMAAPDLTGVNKPLDVFTTGLKHEHHITALIHQIYELAKEEKDYALESFVRWYIDEQVEEEANANEIVDKLKMIGDDGSALYVLDKELSTRTYLPSGPYAAKA